MFRALSPIEIGHWLLGQIMQTPTTIADTAAPPLGDVYGAVDDFQMALQLTDCPCEVIEEALGGLQALAQDADR